MKVLVTGVAGFIGARLAQVLLARGDAVVGIDNLNDYYDPALKHARLALFNRHEGFEFVQADLADASVVAALFNRHAFDAVVNLAAQAGVRYSIENPAVYLQSNILGFGHVLEGCRHHRVGHLVFASSSSVYGANTRLPFAEHHNVDHPVSLYAASKKSNELLAHSYAHLFGLPCTGLRFFTVYGPWGRPDMAPIKFARGIAAGERIPVFNGGEMARDFTFIDDIVEGVVRVLDRPATPDERWSGEAPDAATSRAPYRIYNIGNGSPVALMDFVGALEQAIGRKAQIDFMPMQDGDVKATHADIARLNADFGYRPSTPLGDGVARFIEWFRDYYRTS